MATLQSGNSPGQRIKAGDWLLDSERGVDTKPVKPRFSVFKSIHLDYRKANDAAVKAVAALIKAERNLGELDVDQDGTLDALGLAHMNLGASRQNPLAEYKLGTISDIKELAHEKEAKLLLKMSAKAKKHPNAAVKKAGAAMEKAATAVLNGIKPIEGLIKARDGAMRARDAKAPRLGEGLRVAQARHTRRRRRWRNGPLRGALRGGEAEVEGSEIKASEGRAQGVTKWSDACPGLVVESFGGVCPVQAWGTLLGFPFYFRARAPALVVQRRCRGRRRRRWMACRPCSFSAWSPGARASMTRGYMPEEVAADLVVRCARAFVEAWGRA